jgi:hypothetical protein
MENTDQEAIPGIAIFDANDLQYITHQYLLDKKGEPQDRGSWCAVDPEGFVYSSNRDVGAVNKYQVRWDLLEKNNILKLKKIDSIRLLDEVGAPANITYVQGGVITPSGQLLYLAAGYSRDKDSKDTWRIHVFDLSSRRRVTRSSNGFGYFNFEFHPGGIDREEPEGITIWNLDNGRAPGIRGQLHVLMLDNELDSDHIYFKHYTGTIHVNHAGSEDGKGTLSEPFKTVKAAHYIAWDGSRIKIMAGKYRENLTFSKRVKIIAEQGTVTIGK